MDGVVVVDKPSGITSHDVVHRVRRASGARRVGHLGTLDPLGSGVLPLVLGRATRLSQFFLGHDREYEATIRCGFSTSTYDREGEATTEPVDVTLEPGEIEVGLEKYRGTFSQTPPAVSAKKVGGRRAYKLARAKQEFDLPPVEVTFHELELAGVRKNLFDIRLRCSAGAYVRALAHDLGQDLGCGAHVEALRRTAMGEFSIEQAVPLEEVEGLAKAGRLDEALVPPGSLLPEIPVCRVDEATATRIVHGREFQVSRFSDASTAERIKAVGPDGRLLAIGELRLPGSFHPSIVFN